MVQSRSSPAVSIVLTPMQIPEALPVSMTSPLSDSTDVAGPNLLLHPGEPSEMIVQVQNLSRRPLRMSLRVEGDFPSSWCRIGTEGSEIALGSKMDAVLYFQIPATFFEDQQAIVAGTTDKLILNFRCIVSVYIDQDTDTEKIQQEEFGLYIRPYSNYMEFLPILYREVDYIGRFMKIFEQAFQPVIDSFNVMWANLDPLTSPQALLPFLAHWVAWPVDSIWNLNQQRRLIRRAVELYRWRGTRKGLRLYLHLYTGLPLDEQHISITEPFGQSFVLAEAKLGTAVLAGGRPFHFVVRLRPDRLNRIHEELVRQIIEQEKPAYCTYELLIEATS
ncbi:MAG: phage tail protein [Scytonema hyalinum WJT4-NPBG1]|jgi:phage tail-like protein|nr:phage tail protein [Scytonema hyalinum WJT4-NPBG1]